MTIDEAVLALRKIATKHGGDTDVFFDCPKCGLAFTPNTAAKVVVMVGAAHLEQHKHASPEAPGAGR